MKAEAALRVLTKCAFPYAAIVSLPRSWSWRGWVRHCFLRRLPPHPLPAPPQPDLEPDAAAVAAARAERPSSLPRPLPVIPTDIPC